MQVSLEEDARGGGDGALWLYDGARVVCAHAVCAATDERASEACQWPIEFARHNITYRLQAALSDN